MKVSLNMQFNGRANSFQIGLSRREFDTVQEKRYKELKRDMRELEGEQIQKDEER